MKHLDKLNVEGKLPVEFTDGQLLMIANIYGNLTGKQISPTKLSQIQVNTVIKYLMEK